MGRANAPILVLRDGALRGTPNAFDIVPRWLQANFAPYADDLRIVEVPHDIDDWSGVRLMVPWLLDPVQLWSPEVYEHVLRLQRECDGRGIPVINRVDRLPLAGKFQGAQALARCGLRTPRMHRVQDLPAFLRDFGGLGFPLLLRENWGHQGLMLRIETAQDLRTADLRRIRNPVAIEIVDVRSPQDGLHRLYRYLACGPMGISLHLQRSTGWVTRGRNADRSAAAVEEEARYIGAADPNHARFQAARRELGLQVLAFDYAYDLQGQVVVWEVNPYTRIRFPPAGGADLAVAAHQSAAAHRAVAALVICYRVSAGLPVRRDLLRLLGYARQDLELRQENTTSAGAPG